MTREEIKQAAEELETASPGEILAWAAAHFAPRLTFATSLGIEDCVVTDFIARGALPIELFTLDTGLLFPESYALWTEIQDKYGVVIRPVRPAHTVEEQAQHDGPALWEREPDRCCDLRKMQPLHQMLGNFDAWITAIRRDQTPERANAP